MSRKRNANKKREINPLFIVFCEGETEESYSKYLKNKFRIPIEIKTKVTGQTISDKYISNHIREIRKGASSEKDKCYLMYDLDSPEFSARIRVITNGIILASNPCIEVWFLLHYRDQRAFIDSNNCYRGLKELNNSYEKGKLNTQLIDRLDSYFTDAITRAKALDEYTNPSSTIYKFVEEIIKCDSERKK